VASPRSAHTFDVSDQITNDVDLVDIIVCHFYVGKLIFDGDHQFETG
jgi:hypothetical protein